jgi:hypothetical protein
MVDALLDLATVSPWAHLALVAVAALGFLAFRRRGGDVTCDPQARNRR